jgi:hypothetical protein
MLYVDLNLDGVKPLFASLTKNELSKIMRRAVRHSARKTLTKSVEISSQIYNLKKKELRNRIFTKLNLGTKDEPAAKLEFQFKAIGVEKFNPRQRRDGVTAKILKKDSAIVLKHAFLANSKTRAKGRLVFVRKNAVSGSTTDFIRKIPPGGMRRSPKGSELPIVRLQSKGLSEVMRPHAPTLVELAGSEGQRELERQLYLLLGR